MTQISVLYLKQRDQRGKCLRLELRDFLHRPRLHDGDKKRFDKLGYQGPAILIIEGHNESHGISRSIKSLLYRGDEAVFLDRMVNLLVTTENCQIPERTTNYSEDMWSIIKYRGRHDSLDHNEYLLSEDRISNFSKLRGRHDHLFQSNTRVATWICADTSILRPDPRVNLSGLIVLMFGKGPRKRDSEAFASILQNILSSDGIADAIQNNPLLIHLYLYFCFNDFNRILKLYEHLYNVALSTNGRTTWGISDKSFLLNNALIQISFSLPDILQHKAVLKRLSEYNDQRPIRSRSLNAGTGLIDAKKQAAYTLLSMRDEVEDFEKQVDMFLERFTASLDLEFSVANERMSWVMLWFTFVAILFTPMAFVASIFGMTSLEADPKWFAAAVIPVFLVSCLLCWYIFDKSQRLDDELLPTEIKSLLHAMPYSQIDTIKRTKKYSGHGGPSRRQTRRRTRRHRPTTESGIGGGSEGSSDDSSSPPPMYETVPPPPPVIIGEGEYPGRRPSVTASGRHWRVERPSFEPRHRRRTESSTTYNALRMPDFRPPPPHRPSSPAGYHNSYDERGGPSYEYVGPRPQGRHSSYDQPGVSEDRGEEVSHSRRSRSGPRIVRSRSRTSGRSKSRARRSGSGSSTSEEVYVL
ncbi:hypothetical protein EDB80DRAFT_710628 [Ilyonectria destructans]|nr:hypothetical protein EDB80DRAFT_710628 [Ilyonectria destructans]